MILRAFCETSNVLQIFYFINMIVKILCYVVPAILILMLSIDIFKIVMSGEENVIKNNMKMIVKRIIFAVAIFFVPMIVNIAFGLLGDMQVSAADCYNNATPSGIEKAKQEEEKEYEEYKAKVKAERDEKIEKAKSDEKKKNKENAEKAGNASGLSGKIVSVAKKYSWPYGTSSKKWFYPSGGKSYNGYEQAYKKSAAYSKYDSATMRGTCCCHFAKFVVTEALNVKKFPNFLSNCNSTDIKKFEKYGFTTMPLQKNSKVKAGDIITYVFKTGGGHVIVVIGDGIKAEAGHSGAWPHISKFSVKGIYNSSKRAFIVRPNG